MSLSRKDGKVAMDLVMDALADAGEHYGDDARLRCVMVTLVLEDKNGVHTSTLSQERMNR